MPQLDPTWFVSQIFWLVLCFTALYALLAYVILPRLSGTIEKRADTINDDISQADKANHEAKQAKADYEETLAQSREMAQNLINEVLEDNKQHAEASLAALNVEISNKQKEVAATITNKKQELMSNLTPTAAEFASIIAQKITNSKIDNDQANRAVMDMIKQKVA